MTLVCDECTHISGFGTKSGLRSSVWPELKWPGDDTPDRASWSTRSMSDNESSDDSSDGVECPTCGDVIATDAESPWQDPNVLKHFYVQEMMTSTEIGSVCGCCDSTVRKWMERHGIDRRRSGVNNADKPWTDPEILEELYIDEGMTLSEMSEKLGCSKRTLHRRMDEYDIPRRISGQPTMPWHDPELLERLYCNEGLSLAEIGDKLGCTGQTIRKWMDKYGINRRVTSSNTHGTPWEDSDELERLYRDEEMTLAEIADRWDSNKRTIHIWMKIHGIDCRSVGPRSGEDHPLYKENAHNQYGPNWDLQRKKARERDGYVCAAGNCNITERDNIRIYGRELAVHHITPRSEFLDDSGVIDYERANRLSNLITFCSKHHPRYEGLPLDIRHLCVGDD